MTDDFCSAFFHITRVRKRNSLALSCLVFALSVNFLPLDAMAQSGKTDANDRSNSLESQTSHHNPPDLSVVNDGQWSAIDRSINRGLDYLHSRQQSVGSIPTMQVAKPAVTALYVMAALSAGHEPGEGPLGDSLNRGIDYILSTQNENGLFTLEPVSMSGGTEHKAGQLALYNLGICGTLLGEVYGMTNHQRSARIKKAIEKALGFVVENQKRPLPSTERFDRGGWRYIKRIKANQPHSDLSVTSWLIMFMRSAHNAGFEVPKPSVDLAIDYVRQCFNERTGGFQYASHQTTQITRGMTGAGVLSLFLTGNYDDRIERMSGAWILQQEFTRYNRSRSHDRYFYAAYYCSQAAYQLGGDYWSRTYVPLAETLVAHQKPRGNWDADHHNSEYSDTYSTAMAILALTPPYQLLPIYQR